MVRQLVEEPGWCRVIRVNAAVVREPKLARNLPAERTPSSPDARNETQFKHWRRANSGGRRQAHRERLTRCEAFRVAAVSPRLLVAVADGVHTAAQRLPKHTHTHTHTTYGPRRDARNNERDREVRSDGARGGGCGRARALEGVYRNDAHAAARKFFANQMPETQNPWRDRPGPGRSLKKKIKSERVSAHGQVNLGPTGASRQKRPREADEPPQAKAQVASVLKAARRDAETQPKRGPSRADGRDSVAAPDYRRRHQNHRASRSKPDKRDARHTCG